MRWVGIGLVTLAAGCAERLPPGACRSDTDCTTGLACLAGSCVMRGVPAAAWDVEIAPRVESDQALTERPGVVLASQGNVLQTVAKVPVAVTIELPAGSSSGVAAVRTLVAVPSGLPGKGAVSFEGEGRGGASAGVIGLMLAMPAWVIGKSAQITLLPAAPADQSVPPWRGEVMLAPAVRVRFAETRDLARVSGVVLDALRKPVPAYSVRAFAGDREVGNAASTDALGHFELVVPRGTAAANPLRDLTIEMDPLDRAVAWPRLVLRGQTVDADLGDLGEVVLPSFTQPELFRVPVTGDGRDAVGGATVRFRTSLVESETVSTTYLREAQTGPDGVAAVALIPGTSLAVRSYSIVVVPPGDSVYSPECVPSYAVVSSAGAAGPRTGAQIALGRKLAIDGVLLRADGRPAVNVSVTAMPNLDEGATACGEPLVSPPAAAVTDERGHYRLLLPRGRYDFHFEPGAGSALPLLTEEAVPILASGSRTSTLPVGVVIEGSVVGAGGAAVAGAEVRLLAPQGQRPAGLRGRAVTDHGGRWRLVVPGTPLDIPATGP